MAELWSSPHLDVHCNKYSSFGRLNKYKKIVISKEQYEKVELTKIRLYEEMETWNDHKVLRIKKLTINEKEFQHMM